MGVTRVLIRFSYDFINNYFRKINVGSKLEGGANQCLYCVHLRDGGTVSFGEDEHARARNLLVIVKAKNCEFCASLCFQLFV